MAIVLVKDSRVTGDGSDKGLGKIVDRRWRRERTVRPSEGTPKSGAHVPAAYVVRHAGPTEFLCRAGVAATRRAVRFA